MKWHIIVAICLVILPQAVAAAEAPQSGLFLQGDLDLGLSIHDEFNTGVGVGLGLGLFYLDLKSHSFGGFSAWKGIPPFSLSEYAGMLSIRGACRSRPREVNRNG